MPHRDPEDRRRYHREWYERNKEAQARYMAEWRRREYNTRRPQVIKVLGGVCVMCGIDDERVLHIDHIHGGGHRERTGKDRVSMFAKIINGERTHEFQLLCANCHQIKTYYPESGQPRLSEVRQRQ